MAVALSAACVIGLLASEATWRVDTWIYDALVSHRDQPVDERIVIVAIDERSLSALGRWPWSRGLHADLLARLREAGARGVILNAVFAEPARDDAAGDARLAAALAAAGNVVLPVIAEPAEPGGLPIEVLPMPALVAAAAGLGHVEADIDRDGIVRQTGLLAGLGDPHWPALALALLRTSAGAGTPLHGDAPLPGLPAPADAEASPYQWTRDHRVRIPYAAPGAFPRLSYADVLAGDVDPAALRGRWVLVGTTAAGIDHGLLTPRSHDGHALPSIEYHANLLNALARGETISALSIPRQWALSILLALLPLCAPRELPPRRRGALIAATAAATLLTTALLLHFARLWFPPTATLAVLAAGALAWTLWRLRQSQHLAHSDALTLLANRRLFDLALEREVRAAHRSQQPLSLLIIDVDNFKHYNDRYGHRAGDSVLRRVAIAIGAQARRPRDLAARYGGDEMTVILPDTDAAAALEIAEAMVRDVRALRIPHEESGIAPWVTLTIGVATFVPGGDRDDTDLLERADAALYQAKREGRDRARGASPGAAG
ncbi:CHASE2 domain-containing protein [Luteimonas huabeiensis]|uniref:CHASE2 domain-containing protein n=1 Tax=Luteimonas huabeiensis TaxID=1244513 RepID=UPI0004AD6252|nr:CHASE2 domain-containing protein [Luteimonas huabeiensis]